MSYHHSVLVQPLFRVSRQTANLKAYGPPFNSTTPTNVHIASPTFPSYLLPALSFLLALLKSYCVACQRRILMVEPSIYRVGKFGTAGASEAPR